MFGLPSDRKQRDQVLLGIVAVALLGAYVYFLYLPKREELAELDAHLEQLESKNASAKAIAGKSGPELKKKLALYEQQMVRLEQLVPKSEEVPELLHAMTLRAEESGVELATMKPRPADMSELYTRQVYEMSVYGPYDGVGRFLASVGSLPRIVTPIELKLIPRPNEKTRGGAQRLQADFKIETYVMPGPGAADLADRDSEDDS